MQARRSVIRVHGPSDRTVGQRHQPTHSRVGATESGSGCTSTTKTAQANSGLSCAATPPPSTNKAWKTRQVRSRGPHPCQRLATSYHVLYRPSSIAVHWCWQCLSQQVLAAARTKEAAAVALRRVQTSGSRGGAGGRALTRSGSRPWAAAGRRSCRWCPAAHGDTPLSRSAWRGRWKLAGRCSLQHACSKHSQAAPTLPEAHWLCHVGLDSAHAGRPTASYTVDTPGDKHWQGTAEKAACSMWIGVLPSRQQTQRVRA